MKKTVLKIAAFLVAISVFAGCGNTSKKSSEFDSSKNINLITREEGSGTFGAFVELFGLEQKGADGSKTILIPKSALVETNTNNITVSVANDKNAIGYVSLGSLNDSVKAVSVDGVPAVAEKVKSGEYGAVRGFKIATKGAPTGLAKDFIDYIMSKEGQGVVSASYISVKDDAEGYSGNLPSGSLVVGGSSSVAPLMEKLIEAYNLVNPNASIELQVTDSTTGMNMAISGTYDVGMSSRALKDSEKESLTDFEIALDGIAIVVNKNNPTNNLTKEQIKSIYSGESKTWSEVIG